MIGLTPEYQSLKKAEVMSLSKKDEEELLLKKPSFVIHKSVYGPIKDLSDQDLGMLFRAIFEFQIDRTEINLPKELKMAFGFLKNQFEFSDKSYQATVERNKINGSKGGRPKSIKSQDNPKNPVGSQKPRKPDKEIDKDKDKEIDKDKDKEIDKDKDKEIDKDKDKEIDIKKNIRLRSVDDFHISMSTRLADHIKSFRRISIADSQISNWAKEISLLERKDLEGRKTPFEDIQRALDIIIKHDGEEFFPVIESGKTFRSKFQKIENFVARNSSLSAKKDKFTNNVSASLIAINSAMDERRQSGL
jgi:hypothetical protein